MEERFFRHELVRAFERRGQGDLQRFRREAALLAPCVANGSPLEVERASEPKVWRWGQGREAKCR